MTSADEASLPVTVVVGNPRSGSRTSAAAVATARAVQRHAGAADSEVHVIELADLAADLFAWDSPAVAAAKEVVLSSRALVVASPVFKASFTGLLKAFLDHFARDELAAVATVPLMLGAGPAHSLAVEQQLRPVLIEIGASCPTRGLYLLDNTLDTIDQQLSEWLGVWGNVLTAVTRVGTS